MEDIKVKKFGPSCGKQGSSVFYKALKYKKDGKSQIITLGQFFFMKILDSIPICIGELQLVWEDKSSGTDLASVRLYFLPECTPDGRQPNHGEDEVLAYYEKIVLRLNDLAAMVVHNVSWSEGRRAFTVDTCARDTEYGDLAEAFKMNSYGLDNRDVVKESQSSDSKEIILDSSPDVVIMTYPKYCRYRCMLKRLENCEDKWLQHTLVCALGGFSALKENNRVYFCRDIFEHADLDDFEHRCDHLAPNLKGRPVKRKGSKRDSNDFSDDSNSSSSFSTQQENATNNVRTGSRATPLRNGFRIDKIKVSKDEQAFLIELHKFMKSRNTPIGRIPSLGFKQIDLFQFYTLAQEIGGYEQISAKRMWKNIYDALGGNPGSTSAATYTRRHYEKLLLPFERFKEGKEFKPIHHKKKKFKSESDLVAFERLKVMKSPENGDVRVKGEMKMKPEFKTRLDMKHVENGKSDPASSNKDKVDIRDKTLIIKQEIEKMKMRKDAHKHGTSIMNKANTKITGTLDKKKSPDEGKRSRFGDKGRRPSGGQKTVRELLHQNGQDPSETYDGSNCEKFQEYKQKVVVDKEERRITEILDTGSKREHIVSSISQVLPGNTDSKPLPSQTLLPSISSPRPMFYPQLIPVGGAIRNMTPLGMPFMIGPPFGFQSVANQIQPMEAIGSIASMKEEKPLNALNKLVSEQNTGPSVNRNSVPSLHGKSNLSNITPPSAHSSQTTSKGPLVSPQSGPPIHRPITPAHSHNTKRQYPYPDTNRNHPTYSSNYSAKDTKLEPVSDTDLKRQKLHGSQEKQPQSSSGEFEMPVLDLSMKTLRAQEARHQRGESLLFNTSFNKENRTVPKAEPCDAPQDLSLKSKTNSVSNERASSAHKSVPLNIPFPRLPTATTPVKKEEEVKKERFDPQPQASSKAMIPASSVGPIATIGGLPLDLGSFVHPAFPPQMLMQGAFPTPLQLQQMIQGQVAAGMPMLRPDFIPSPLMFPPSMSIVAPSMFTNVLPSASKTSTSTVPIVKR